MGRYYDNWEKLVEAVRRREQLRSLSLADSWSSSMRSMDSDFSSSSTTSRQDSLSLRTTPSPLDTAQLKLKLRHKASIWKRLSIFGGFSSKKKDPRMEREAEWAKAHRTLHGLHQMDEKSDEEAKRRTEIERLRELHTLKGHIESLAKAKGIDLDTMDHYYTL